MAIKNKLSNQILNDLLERARKLPRVSQVDKNGNLKYKQVQVPGHKLNAADLKPGQVLDPKLVYAVNEIVMVDHYATMVTKFKLGGMPAVDEYEEVTMALQKYSTAMVKKPWYKKFWADVVVTCKLMFKY